MPQNKTVTILLFDDVEVLDFTGPFEAFSVAVDMSGGDLWQVKTVSVSERNITARYGMKINADEVLSPNSETNVLIIPGGRGVREIIHSERQLSAIKRFGDSCETIITVCTGSLVAAKLGWLSGKKATTHYENLDDLKKIDPTIRIVQQRYVDNGRIICAEGVSAGIDVSLYYIASAAGNELAEKTATYMMYEGEWKNSSRNQK